MLRFDDKDDYNRTRDFLQRLAPREAWCNTGLMSHGTDWFCPYCSRYLDGKEYWGIDYAHFDYNCRWCHVRLVDQTPINHKPPCVEKYRDEKGCLIR